MLRHLFIAAWRDLARSPVQSFITIGGLVIGLVATILAGLIGVAAFSHDHFVPGYERLYYAVTEYHDAREDKYYLTTSNDLAAYLGGYPEIDGVARIAGHTVVVRQGNITAREQMDWTDPQFFRLYRAPVLYGNLDTALDRPDGAVINRKTAEKYFGRDDVVGQTLQIDHAHTVIIRAVIEDFPFRATAFEVGLFISSLAPYSMMSEDIGRPGMTSDGSLRTSVFTLVRLKPDASVSSLDGRASALLSRFVPAGSPFRRAMHFERLDGLHASPDINPDTRPRLWDLAALALVILTLSCVNFVNLSLGRSTQRGLEVAIRKAVGAARRALIAQFLGESILQTLIALVLATGIVEWSLPSINAFLNTGAIFNYWRNPPLLAAMICGAVAIGVVAGTYPAFVLSAFRPATVLKGLFRRSAGGERLRQLLVSLQFAAMIVFLIAANTLLRQYQFVTVEAMGVPVTQTVMISMPKCDEAFKNRVAALPGVLAAACSSVFVLPDTSTSGIVRPQNGSTSFSLGLMPVDVGFLELYGLTPIAGRFFRADGSDAVDKPLEQTVHYVINETAMRQMGYANALAAIGRPIRFASLHGSIIGVVKDFSLTPPDSKPHPTAYALGNPENLDPAPAAILHVKLKAGGIPQTLSAIDGEWRKFSPDPINRQFLDDYIQNYEAGTLRGDQAFAVFAGVAMLLGCMGLFGISLFTAARRTKEIGIRKAMGATSADIVLLLLWQFAKPVLGANLIAWPLAFWAMQRWLSGFAYHIALPLWIFPAASAAALAIAILTVGGQAIIVALQKPVLALRYE